MGSPGGWWAPPNTLTQPPFAADNDPAIVIFPDPIPPEIQTVVRAAYGVAYTVIGALLWRKSSTLYQFDAMAYKSTAFAIFRGAIFGPGLGAVAQAWIYDTVSASYQLDQGRDVTTQFINLGELGNAGIEITKSPSLATSLLALAAGDITLTGDATLIMTGVNDDVSVTDFGGSAVSIGRGHRAQASSSSNSGAIGTTESAVVTISNFVFRANRAYKVEFGPAITLSLTTNVGQFRLRKTNATGTVWGDAGAYGPSGAPPNVAASGRFYVRRNAGSDLTATFVLTLQASSSGTATQVGQATQLRYMRIMDAGDAADFPDAIAVT